MAKIIKEGTSREKNLVEDNIGSRSYTMPSWYAIISIILVIGITFTIVTNYQFSIKNLLIKISNCGDKLYTPQEIFQFEDYSKDITGKALELAYFDNPLRLDKLGKLLNYRINEYGKFLKDLGTAIYRFFQNIFVLLEAII